VNVLVAIGQYHPIKGGAERQAQKQAEILVKIGVDVDVVTYHRRGLKKYEIINGVSIYRLRGMLYKGIKTYSLLGSLLLFVSINKKKYDVILSHQALLTSFSSVLAGKLFNLPVCVRLGSPLDFERLRHNYFMGGVMYSYMLKNTTKFIATTDQICDVLQKNGIEEERIALIPNGVELLSSGATLPARQINHNGKNIYIFSCVSRLHNEKNIGFLIHILSSINFEFRCTIFGDGPAKKEIQEKINDYKMNYKIHLRGNVDSQILYNSLRESHFLLQPSPSEGLSNALLEGIANGLIPIVSDIPSNRFVLGDVISKQLCVPLDHDKWVYKLSMLCGNSHTLSDIRILLNQRIKEFDIDKIALQYDELMKKVVADTPKHIL
jgi:L-malate glycosyltransferase